MPPVKYLIFTKIIFFCSNKMNKDTDVNDDKMGYLDGGKRRRASKKAGKKTTKKAKKSGKKSTKK